MQMSETSNFKKRYESLYLNVRTDSNAIYLHTAIFCLKRMLIAISSVFFPKTAVLAVAVYTYGALGTLGFIYSYKPMQSPAMNKVEMLNELYMLATAYFMIAFSEMVEIETRMKVGKVHFAATLGILVVNFMIIVSDMIP